MARKQELCYRCWKAGQGTKHPSGDVFENIRLEIKRGEDLVEDITKTANEMNDFYDELLQGNEAMRLKFEMLRVKVLALTELVTSAQTKGDVISEEFKRRASQFAELKNRHKALMKKVGR